MYTPVKIEALSKQQISRLLNGHSVRVKHGTKHTIHVSKEQHKKLVKAHQKGSGLNLTFDPYQMEEHQHLRGEGILSQAKKAYKHAGHFVKKHKEHFRPLASALKQSGHEAIANASMSALEHGVNPDLVSAYGSMGHNAIGGSLKSFTRGLSHFVKTPAVKTIRRALKPLGRAVWNDVNAAALQGLQSASTGAMAGAGMGIHRNNGLPKGLPRKYYMGAGMGIHRNNGLPKGLPRKYYMRAGSLMPGGY